MQDVGEPREPLGLIAGNGVFPLLVAGGARAAGVPVVAVAHRGETQPEIEGAVDECTWVRVGELGKIIKVLKAGGCRRAVMAGGIAKVKLFGGFKPDLRGAAFLAKTRSVHDDKLLRGIAAELEIDGIDVIPSTEYLPELLPEPGVLTRKKPKSRDREDILFGRRVAQATGAFEIGQTVVVQSGLVLAIEAVEGTDAAIRRGGQLGKGGAVVVKASKPGQDLRFDVPAVGPNTIELMREVGARVLAVEARRTLLLEREALVSLANEAGIVLVAFDPEEAV